MIAPQHSLDGDLLTGAGHEDLLGAHHNDGLTIEQFLRHHGREAAKEVALTVDHYLLLKHLRGANKKRGG